MAELNSEVVFELDEVTMPIAGSDGTWGVGHGRYLCMKFARRTFALNLNLTESVVLRSKFMPRTIRLVLYDCCRSDLFLDDRKEESESIRPSLLPMTK